MLRLLPPKMNAPGVQGTGALGSSTLLRFVLLSSGCIMDLMTDDLELGYFFYPSEYPGLCDAHPRLDIHVYDQPTGRHFDPEWSSFWVAEPGGGLCQMVVSHPWHGGDCFRVCAGRIIMRDRKDKVVEAYSFGGELDLESTASSTICRLTSAAPIFELVGTHSFATILVSEFESLLARQHASCGTDDREFSARLASIEPPLLFAAGLTAIEERLDCLPQDAQDGLYAETLEVIRNTMRAMRQQDRWPASLPTLDSLL